MGERERDLDICTRGGLGMKGGVIWERSKGDRTRGIRLKERHLLLHASKSVGNTLSH